MTDDATGWVGVLEVTAGAAEVRNWFQAAKVQAATREHATCLGWTWKRRRP